MFDNGKIGCAIFLAVLGAQSSIAQDNPATQQALPVENSQLPPALSDNLNLTNRMNQPEQTRAVPALARGQQFSPYGLACDVTLSATKTAGAMVLLDLTAPCHANKPVTIHHAGLVFTDVTSSFGLLAVSVPAMTTKARFDVAFPDGETVFAVANVPEASGFDRAAVQWVGAGGLKIHAFELGASYGGSGYITVLGGVNLPDAKHAEVYSFPTGEMNKSGVVRLSLKAKVTADTCGKEIQAQVLQSGISVVNLTLSMPGCDAIGQFLVLNTILRDLKIAQNRN